MRMPHIQSAKWVPKALGALAVPALAVTALVTTAADERPTVQTTEAATPVESLPPAARKAPSTTIPATTTTTTGVEQTDSANDEMASATSEPGSNPEAVASPTTRPPTATSAPGPTPTAAAPTTSPPPPPTAPPTTSPPPPPSKNCVVRLHGKGGGGSATATNNGVTEIRPTGNGSGWGGRQWSYSNSGDYAAALGVISGAVDNEGCNRVVLIGFSNGASMAAKVFCQGETLGGRLARVIVDDPVTDQAVNGCHPAGGVGMSLYWTGALQGVAQPGWNCGEQDWTCEGGSTIGIDAYAAALRTGTKSSPNSGSHSAYSYPPEIHQF